MMVTEGTIFGLGGVGSEGAVFRDSMLEVHHLLRWAVSLGEGWAEAEEVGWGEAEDLEERTREASQVTSAVEGPCIIRRTRLTLRSSSGVS